MNILILTNHLKDFGGSEIQVLEIYEYFKQKNHTVKIYANYTGQPVIDFFQPEDVIADIKDINLNQFDLVWSQHAVFSRLFKDKTYPNLKLKLISVHLSPFELLELSSLPYMAQLNPTFVANSEETKTKLLEFAVPEANIIVSGNPAPDIFRQTRPARSTLQKILVVSNHAPDEIRQAAELLRRQNVTVDFLGMGSDNKQRVTPEILAGYDVIVSIGKTVQYALLGQIPVYNYDHFGGCGYLNTNNFEKARELNFSGRGFGKKTEKEIVEEILTGFKQGSDFVSNLTPPDGWLLSKFMQKVLDHAQPITLLGEYGCLLKLSSPIEERFSSYYTDLTNVINRVRSLEAKIEKLNALLNQERNAAHDKQIHIAGHVRNLEDKIEELNVLLNQERNAAHDKQIHITNLEHMLADEQASLKKLSRYSSLYSYKAVKPLLSFERGISSANRYRKMFCNLIKEKGSIGKAYQTCRRTYKNSGIRAVKALLRQQNLDLQSVEELSIENAKEGFVILTTKHTHYIAKLFSHALKKVGIDSSIIFETPKNGYSDKWHIVICPQMFESMPSHYLAFQMEQSVSSRWFTAKYFQRLHDAAHVFDYSLTNIAFLQEHQLPFKQLHYMPIGILPSSQPQQHTDFEYEYEVAFYGDPNCERRQLFLKKLQENFSVKVISEVFGDELHALLKKAKIVVNIHYYENALLETTRIYECLSLNKLVVSEKGSDQNEHSELGGIVDFVEIDDVDSMIRRIAYWLSSPTEFESRLQKIHYLQQQPDKFQFYLYRFLLSQDLIDFETFYRLSSSYVKPQGDFWCLSLPESVARRQDFDRDNHYGIFVLPGLRHNIGWIGCGLSYKFMMRIAEDLKFPHVTICEDDVLFTPEFKQRYAEIKHTLANTSISWDVYSGLIADLSENSKILQSPIHSESEHFYEINKLVSMVFNIYNQSAYSKIYTWNEHDRLFHNTIDRYIEHHGDIKGVITSPFLVGHKEELFSTLWGKQNTIYREMIAKSQKLLNQKIANLQDKPLEN